MLEESIRSVEQSQEQLKTFDSKIEENAPKPEYAKKVKRYQTLRGVSTVTSMTIVAEVWDMRRYGTAPQFMGSTGLVSSEYSTGDHERRGKITKAGNAHLRRVLVEAAWHYRHRASAGKTIKKRRQGQPQAVVSIAEPADQRLNRKFRWSIATTRNRLSPRWPWRANWLDSSGPLARFRINRCEIRSRPSLRKRRTILLRSRTPPPDIVVPVWGEAERNDASF